VPTVTVHRVRCFDIISGKFLPVSPRLATEAGAKIMGADLIPNTAVEIDIHQLEAGEEWTAKGFDPDQQRRR
jgi:hypothetical protein